MMVNLEQVQLGVVEFIEKEIGSKATGFKKFGVYFFLPTIKKSVVDYVSKIKGFIPDLFDENNNVDLDKFYGTAKEAIRKSGQFEFMGIIFNETDIDKLYSYIKHTGTTSVL